MSIGQYDIEELGTLLIAVGIEMVNYRVGAGCAGDSPESINRLVRDMMRRGIEEERAREIIAEVDLQELINYIPIGD